MEIENDAINKIRQFNRFYTNLIGLLENGYLHSPFTLTEARILFEIYYTKDCTAKAIRKVINIDEGYLSRILDSFARQKLLIKSPSAKDRRLNFLMLTGKGKTEFLKLEKKSRSSIHEVLNSLSEEKQIELVLLMQRIEDMIKGNFEKE